jgi:hypothetical protein
MDPLTNPGDIKAAYDLLSDEAKQGLSWKLVKQNKSWVAERQAVKSHLEQHRSLSLDEARKLSLVSSTTAIDQFKKCVIEPIKKSGFPIVYQRGALPRNAVLFHTPGNAVIVTTSVFDKPCKEAAIIVVSKYINGFSGSVNILKKIESSNQFPFMKVNADRKRFNKLIISNLPSGWTAPQRPFVYNKVKK